MLFVFYLHNLWLLDAFNRCVPLQAQDRFHCWCNVSLLMPCSHQTPCTVIMFTIVLCNVHRLIYTCFPLNFCTSLHQVKLTVHEMCSHLQTKCLLNVQCIKSKFKFLVITFLAVIPIDRQKKGSYPPPYLLQFYLLFYF